MTATEEARPPRLVLGIETSCDETAAAVVEDGIRVRSSVVATQHDLHEEYGGVVPEIASRAHLERILPVVRRAIADAGVRLEDLDAVAVGHRPGLIGALLVGTSAAKGLALALDVPLVGVDHVHAHLVAGMLEREPPALPALGLVASGGHSSIYLVEDPIHPRLLGRTIDDAIGEAFDKVAAMLDLGHPGGPAVERLAESGDPTAFTLPVANLGRESLDFSFSGLKTAVLYAAQVDSRAAPHRSSTIDGGRISRPPSRPRRSRPCVAICAAPSRPIRGSGHCWSAAVSPPTRRSARCSRPNARTARSNVASLPWNGASTMRR